MVDEKGGGGALDAELLDNLHVYVALVRALAPKFAPSDDSSGAARSRTWLTSSSAARGLSAALPLAAEGACLQEFRDVRRREEGEEVYVSGAASSPSSRRACIVMLSFFFDPSVSVAPFLRAATLGRGASNAATGSRST